MKTFVKTAAMFGMIFAAFLPMTAQAQSCSTVPGNPTFTAGATAGTASITWDASMGTQGCSLDGYVIHIRVSTDGWTTGAFDRFFNIYPAGVTATSVDGGTRDYIPPDIYFDTATTTVNVAGLTAGITYEMRMNSYVEEDSGEVSAWTSPISFTAPDPAPPAALTAAAKSGTADTVTLTWTNSATAGAAHYVRWRRGASGAWESSDGENDRDCNAPVPANCGGDESANSGGLEITRLWINTAYEFEVVAVAAGKVTASGVVTATTNDTRAILVTFGTNDIPSLIAERTASNGKQTFYTATVGSSVASVGFLASNGGGTTRLGQGATEAAARAAAAASTGTGTATLTVNFIAGATTYVAAISNFTDMQTYIAAITRATNTDATLPGMTVAEAAGTTNANPVLHPAFDPAITEYRISVDRLSANGMYDLVFTPTLLGGTSAAGSQGNMGAFVLTDGATTGVTGDLASINGFALGTIEYIMTVTAADGSTMQAYRFHIIVGPDISAITLADATGGGGADIPLSPAFNRNHVNYTAGSNGARTIVANAVEQVLIKSIWTMDGPNATIGIRGATAEAVTDNTGASGNTIALAAGENIIDFVFEKTGASKSDTTYTIIIIRADGPEISFAQSTTTLAEDAGGVTFTVNLSPAATADIALAFTANGATDGEDYTISASPIAISSGATSAEIGVSIIDDAIGENTETLTITLSPATGYQFAGGVAPAHAIMITDNDAPAVVMNLSGDAVSGDDTMISAQWDVPPGTLGANPYQIRHRVKSPLGRWTNTKGAAVGDTETTAGCDCRQAQIAAAAGVEYEFQVRASNTVGDGAWSGIVAQTNSGAAVAPDAPTDVAATDGANGVTLNWTAPAGTVDDYRLRYRNADTTTWQGWIDAADIADSPVIGDDASGNGFSIGQTATAYTVGGLTRGMTFELGVAAVRAEVLGAFDDVIFAVPAGATLSSLTISQGMLDPDFDAAILSYALTVPFATTTLTLTPAAAATTNITVNNAAATAAVNVAIADGDEISIGVTAAGLAAQNYLIGIIYDARRKIDVNADGEFDYKDGVLIARYIFGIRGDDLVGGIAAAADAAADITARIKTEADAGGFNVDKENQTTAADAILIARYLLGVESGAGLTAAQVSSGKERDVVESMEALIDTAAQ